MISRAALAARLAGHAAANGCPVVSPAEPDAPTSFERSGEFGELLGRFHAAVDDFESPPGSAWTRLHPLTLMGPDADWLERTYARAPHAGERLVAWRAAALVALSARPADDVGMCHGEAFPATCRPLGDGLAIAELDWAGVGARAYDLATFRWSLALHAPDEADAHFERFLDGYASQRPVPDLATLRAWVAARHLWSLRLAAGFADPHGLAERARFVEAWPLDPLDPPGVGGR